MARRPVQQPRPLSAAQSTLSVAVTEDQLSTSSRSSGSQNSGGEEESDDENESANTSDESDEEEGSSSWSETEGEEEPASHRAQKAPTTPNAEELAVSCSHSPVSDGGLDSSLSPFASPSTSCGARHFASGQAASYSQHNITNTFESERGHVLRKILEGQEKACIALAGMAVVSKGDTGQGDGESVCSGSSGGGVGGIGRGERRRKKIAEILLDGDKVQSILKEHGLGGTGVESTKAWQAPVAVDNGHQDKADSEDSDDEQDKLAVRHRLDEMARQRATERMMHRDMFGMGSANSPEFGSSGGGYLCDSR